MLTKDDVMLVTISETPLPQALAIGRSSGLHRFRLSKLELGRIKYTSGIIAPINSLIPVAYAAPATPM